MNIVSTSSLTPTTKIEHSILEDVHIGDWFWVKDKWGWHDEQETEKLCCVKHIGSNHIEFSAVIQGEYETNNKIHFDSFYSNCRPEVNWKEIIQNKITELQQEMQDAMQLLIQQSEVAGYRGSSTKQLGGEISLLPTVCHSDISQYKRNLLALKENAPKVATNKTKCQNNLYR